MKKMLLMLLLVMGVGVTCIPVFANEEVNEVQLTDYRYKNVERGLYGYTFADCQLNSYENANSVILNINGTELFGQGEYLVPYRIVCPANGGKGHYWLESSFPQYENWFAVGNRDYDATIRDRNTYKIIDTAGNIVFDLGETGPIFFVDNDTALIEPSFKGILPSYMQDPLEIEDNSTVIVENGHGFINFKNEVWWVLPEQMGFPVGMGISTDGQYYRFSYEVDIERVLEGGM